MGEGEGREYSDGQNSSHINRSMPAPGKIGEGESGGGGRQGVVRDGQNSSHINQSMPAPGKIGEGGSGGGGRQGVVRWPE